MILIFLVGVYFLFLYQLTRTNTKKECKPHQWSYTLDGSLICSLCSKTPSVDPIDKNSPY